MKHCANCRSTIIFGGKRQGDLWFCDDGCAEQGRLIAIAGSVPDGLARTMAANTHASACPICGRQGPVDVHVSHRTWSLGYKASVWTKEQVSCRRCGIRAQLRSIAFSGVCGWWGPKGFILVPIQIVRNVYAIFHSPAPDHPSECLVSSVRMDVANAFVAKQRGRSHCPTCGSVYELADYRPDAEHIFCSACKAELARAGVQPEGV